MPELKKDFSGCDLSRYTPPFSIDADLYKAMQASPSSFMKDTSLFVPGAVVDVGAGNCRNSLPLARTGRIVYAVDRGLQMESNHPNVVPINADIEDLRFPRAANFLIVYTLRFLPRSSAERTINAMMDATEPNGVHLHEDLLPMTPFIGRSGDPERWFSPLLLEEMYNSAGWFVEHSTRPIPTVYVDANGEQVWHDSARVIAQNTSAV